MLYNDYSQALNTMCPPSSSRSSGIFQSTVGCVTGYWSSWWADPQAVQTGSTSPSTLTASTSLRAVLLVCFLFSVNAATHSPNTITDCIQRRGHNPDILGNLLLNFLLLIMVLWWCSDVVVVMFRVGSKTLVNSRSNSIHLMTHTVILNIH